MRLAIIIAPKSQLYSQATLLEQVLTNLLNNSLQAGSQQITLRWKPMRSADANTGRRWRRPQREQLAQPFVPFRSTKSKDLAWAGDLPAAAKEPAGGTDAGKLFDFATTAGATRYPALP
ncbi:Signal transduction histidine kinase regulating C4-dicarboxylate transport system [Serratia fonticola]|uniref:Signal transduction histidine kinase regulating C4-dicarboxylate transport system n=1 Tax=Serratia fonticola TaxID=47917 RepID=A0A4U9U7J0_SERFO|nr:Signal transduction histidine kinase regulating C4-dicarboxylate transport system [Serratia fonticola]